MKILIARPEPQASELKKILEADGHDCILSPAIEYQVSQDQALAKQQLADCTDQDNLIFISRQAVKSTLQLNGTIPSHKIIFAIGKGTASALRDAGIESVFYPEKSNSEGLLAMPECQNVAKQNFKIIRGGEGRELLSSVLTERGANVETVESYCRACLKGDHQLLLGAWQAGIDCVVLTSLEIAQCFAKQLGEEVNLLQQSTITMMSDRMHQWADDLKIENRLDLDSGRNTDIAAQIRGLEKNGQSNSNTGQKC